MCGIAGVLHFHDAPPVGETLQRMADRIAHRGPDAEGFYEDRSCLPAIGLAHRRLAIIDLSTEANQPLANEDGSVQVVLNGEIYNFRDLRAELAPRHVFRSHGDTEVIAHGYEERGEEFVARLDGMFALAIWDAPRRRLVLARDSFGKKPLYYWSDGNRFVFGSEIKAILAAGVPVTMAEENLPEYLAFGYVPTPRTLFRGVFKVPPAATLAVDAGGVHTTRPYWDLAFTETGKEARVTPAEASERIESLLVEAVRKRLIADVPLGLLLSGGLDSSAVAALMTRLSPSRVKTFTVGFEGDSFYDERAYADTVAQHLGTEHHPSVIRPDAAGLVETLLEHHDEPFGDSSALPTYLVAREARRHVTVVLNGDGGDEVFAGYEWFFAALLADASPDWALRGLSRAMTLIPGAVNSTGSQARMRRFLVKAARPEIERVFGWTTHFDLPEIDRLCRDLPDARGRALSSYREILSRAQRTPLLSRLLYLNARSYLLDDLLPKMDRMTMAHGLEARSPFLDRPLAEYAATLPAALKRRGSNGKIVLKHAFRKLLPPAIVYRPKHGFGLPLAEWFRTNLRGMAGDLLLGSTRLNGHLAGREVRALLEDHLARRVDNGARLWTLLTLELWLRRHQLG